MLSGINKIKYHKIYELSLALIAFFMLVFPKLILISILFNLLVSFLGIIKRKLVFEINLINILLVVLYLVYVIGLIFTNHFDIAAKCLEYKLSLLVFPIIFSFGLKTILSIKNVCVGFFLGIIILVVLGLINSIFLYINLNTFDSFLSVNFSYIHHPTYFSSFTFLGMLLVQYAKKEEWFGQKKWIYILLFIIMLLGQCLSFSLAGVLILFIYLAFLFLKNILKSFGRRVFLIFSIIIPFSIGIIFFNLPGLKLQVETSKKYLVEYLNDPIAFIEQDQTYIQGDETRLIMWTVAFLEFVDNPMGSGTGNIYHRLNSRLLEYGQVQLASKNYNPHNQYLQIAVEVGFFGLIIFLSIIIYFIFLGIQFKNIVMVFFGLNLAFNSFFESMLERQSGIVFFTFWICLFTLMVFKEKSKLNHYS